MNVRNIVIEGCDGTGKTTLCKKLAEKYGWDIVHVTSKDPNDFDFYKETLRKTNVIFDRHFIGELIYPEVYNRDPKLDYNDALWLKNYVKKTNTCVLILTTNIDEIKRRLEERGEEPFVFDKVESIDKQFKMWAFRFNFTLVDTTKNSFEEICNYIEKFNNSIEKPKEKKFKVITLCGSTKFKKEFEEVNKKLTLEGNIVISVGCFGHSGDKEPSSKKVKELLDEIHKSKIDLADEIFVINKNNYIGKSTKSEIDYAKSKGKVIRFLEEK